MDVQLQGCVAAPYRRRRPADTPLYRVVQNHLETFLSRGRDEWWEARVPPHAERELRRFLECGILAHGFARARCDACGHDFLIAFSCNTRRMAETAAHLADHVLPRVPMLALVLLFPDWVLFLFTPDADLVAAATAPLLVVILAALIAVPAEIHYASVVGRGDTPAVFAIQTLVSVTVLVIAWYAGLVLGLPLAYVWMAEVIGWGVCLAAAWAWIRAGHWRRLDV